MDRMGNLVDAGTDGGFAYSGQPTGSDCIFAEISVGTGRSFYQERGENKKRTDEGFSWNGYLYTKKGQDNYLKNIVILENWTFILYFDSHNFRNFVLFS